MTQTQRRLYLIRQLLQEQPEYAGLEIPEDEDGQKRLLRSLFNIRMPAPASREFLTLQDAYLQEETRRRGITEAAALQPVQPGLFLWQGDITTLRCDAIVNAANSGMLGCFVPCHGCIDNAIHTAAGVQLRLACARLMAGQQTPEPTGRARITPAYNLPCRFVLHTVGPIIRGRVTQGQQELLAGCYRSCLELAAAHGLRSVAFCCISTGEFHVPAELAARTAIHTVQAWQQAHPDSIEVIFNVYQDSDLQIYQRLLQPRGTAAP